MSRSPRPHNEGSAIQPARRSAMRRALVAAVLLAAVPVVGSATTTSVQALRPTCTGATYTVVKGDFWARIAARQGVDLAALLASNGATAATLIFPGQVLCLPGAPLTTSPTTVPATSAPVTAAPTAAPVRPLTIRQFPVQGRCWFTDTWGAARSGGRQHEGVDIIAKAGQLVYAVDAGTLTKQYVDAPGSLAGNGWRLQRSDGTHFFYAHLSAFADGLVVGSKVAAGQILGYIGMTGNAGAPHLHFEVHPGGGAPINPTAIVRAVDGCAITAVPTQPTTPTQPSTPPTTPPGTTTPVTPPTTKPPSTTAPSTPVTTAPVTNTPVTTAPLPAPQSAMWRFTAPVAALDTRGKQLQPNSPRSVQVEGLAGVPVGASGAMVRINVRNAAARGSITAHPCGTPPSGAATLGFMPGRLNATTTTVKVVNGSVCLTATAAVDVRLDVVAVQAGDGVGMQPITATRAIDTRSSSPLTAGGTKVALPKALGAPKGAKAVTATITLLDPASAGSIGVGPCGGTPWILTFPQAEAQVFSAVVRTNDAGVCVSSSVEVQVVVDITGVWNGNSPVAPVAPKRVYDSRRGGPVTTKGSMSMIDVPKGATRAVLSVSAIAGAQGGALYVWNCLQPKPAAAAVSVGANAISTATVSLTVAPATLCLMSTGSLHAVVDLVGAG